MDDSLIIITELLIFGGILYACFRLYVYLARRGADYNRTLSMVFLKVVVQKKESKEDREDEVNISGKDFKETCGMAAHLYESLHSIYSNKLLKGPDFFSLEYVVLENQIHFYVVVPKDLVSLVEKQFTAFYPDCFVDQTEDYNIFKENSKFAVCQMELKKDYIFPIKTYSHLNSDPINNITNVLSKSSFDDGAALQILIRPIKNGWQKKGRDEAKNMFNQKKKTKLNLNPLLLLKTMVEVLLRGEVAGKSGDSGSSRTTPLTDEEVKALEEKNSKSGYEFIIRIVTVAASDREAKSLLSNIKSSFVQFGSPNGNSFATIKRLNPKRIIKNFILRNFEMTLKQKIHKKKNIISSDELASLFHLPNIRFNKAPTIAWQNYKIAPPPQNLPKEGILLGHNIYRGVKTEVRVKREDRFRHFYVIGQTGTGKSTLMQAMIRQDFKNGDGLAIIDPHGSLIDDVLPFIPRERADDVIYFNPSDTDRPLGLNLLEGADWDEKEYVSMEAMNIMLKLFGEEIFGPRIQDYFRNGCLTLMSDPEGGALTDIVRLFTDDDYQKVKVEHVTNPIIRSFWENQMAKTGAREKQEMIPYFSAKFGGFVTNSMIRNIIGQAKSAFDFNKAMQEGKIILINLSKGTVGEVNSRLLGLIIVSKIQMAALARQKMPKDVKKKDFFLYIDEFQNYITDSIESILSEARKYRLGMVMANQYIKQLEGADGKSKVKDAVFGNVGSMMCYKIGATDAEYMAKEMAPVFTDQDLINVDKYKGAMKLSIDGQPSRPFSIIPINPYLEKGDLEAAEAFKQLSRLKFGRDREFVDREILRRLGAVL